MMMISRRRPAGRASAPAPTAGLSFSARDRRRVARRRVTTPGLVLGRGSPAAGRSPRPGALGRRPAAAGLALRRSHGARVYGVDVRRDARRHRVRTTVDIDAVDRQAVPRAARPRDRHYDSFVYNLVQYLGELGAEPIVHRNDALTVDEALALEPDARAALARARAARRTPASSATRSRPSPSAASRCSACASATRRSATSTAPTVVRAPQLMHGKTSRDRARRRGRVRRPAVAADGDPLPLARRSTRHRARRASRSRRAPPTASVMGVRHRELAGRGRAVPPGEHPHRARPRPAAQLPRHAPPDRADSLGAATAPRRSRDGVGRRRCGGGRSAASWWSAGRRRRGRRAGRGDRRGRLTDDDRDGRAPVDRACRAGCSGRARVRRWDRPAAARGT